MVLSIHAFVKLSRLRGVARHPPLCHGRESHYTEVSGPVTDTLNEESGLTYTP